MYLFLLKASHNVTSLDMLISKSLTRKQTKETHTCVVINYGIASPMKLCSVIFIKEFCTRLQEMMVWRGQVRGNNFLRESNWKICGRREGYIYYFKPIGSMALVFAYFDIKNGGCELEGEYLQVMNVKKDKKFLSAYVFVETWNYSYWRFEIGQGGGEGSGDVKTSALLGWSKICMRFPWIRKKGNRLWFQKKIEVETFRIFWVRTSKFWQWIILTDDDLTIVWPIEAQVSVSKFSANISVFFPL